MLRKNNTSLLLQHPCRNPMTLLFPALAAFWQWSCTDRPVSETTPLTNNLFVDAANLSRVEKLDLLFMIDNSGSMADKQKLLSEAVPKLLDRLMNPPCVVESTGEIIRVASPTELCPRGEREFPPLNDVHVGVITSSLGSLGSANCKTNSLDPESLFYANDFGHLVATVRPNAPATYKDLGFLAWDNRPVGAPNRDPLATNDLTAIQQSLGQMVNLAGEAGCGFESSLESWYRFLIDPVPFENATVLEGGKLELTGIDQVLLEQRKAFLRPDSMVAILMLTDENDCSMRADGYGWLVGAGRNDVKSSPSNSTTACDTGGPNDPCCASCWSRAELPAQCTPVASDPKCVAEPDKAPDDAPNARCWEQKRRFGLDLLYPTSRYEVALKNPIICPNSSFGDADCSCTRAKELGVPCDPGPEVLNPLYQDLTKGMASGRDSSLVFLAGIVGVPWQDIATAETRDPANPELDYLTADELAANVPGTDFTYWDLILGDANNGILPKDPYMIETPNPRLDFPPNPLVNAPMASAEATSALASPINGHEWNPPHNENHFDLQYACTFQLPETMQRDCEGDTGSCDCEPDSSADALTSVLANKSPLCQDPATGEYRTRQMSAKAYPGLRQLEVLKRTGTQAIVASICPKTLTDGPSYGYNPAVNALVDRLKIRLGDKCLPRKLAPDATTGQVPCRVIEALPPDVCATALPLPGRTVLEGGGIVDEIMKSLETRELCTSDGSVAGASDCQAWCFSEIAQLQGLATGEPLRSCQYGEEAGLGSNVAGYCYVDADQGLGSASLLANCPDTQKRLLRFVGADTPRTGAITFYACSGAATRRVTGQQMASAPVDGRPGEAVE